MNGSSKTTWVLLRGWTREKRHWREFPAMLGKETAGDVIAIDLPGAGTECSRESPLNVRDIMEDVRKRLKRGSLPQKAIVVGISMGGMVALDWASAYPEDFSGIVLINSSLANLSKAWERLRFKNLPAMVRLSRLKNPEEMEDGILRLTSSLTDEMRGVVAREFSLLAKESPVHRMTLLRQLVAAMRFSPRSWPRCPALVISSRHDRLVSSRCSERLAARLKASVSIHPSAGHDLPLDDPQWLSTEMANWYIKTIT
jgi:pimeloyl-ACP methyl ester carboxylesterase